MSRHNPDDSPAVLDDGRWVIRAGVKHWIPAPKPKPVRRQTWTNVKRYDWENFDECRYCGAEPQKPCRSGNGVTIVPAHRIRLGAKVCATCDVEIRSTKTYCDPCGRERRRAAWREKEQRKRARHLAEVTPPTPITQVEDDDTCRQRLTDCLAS